MGARTGMPDKVSATWDARNAETINKLFETLFSRSKFFGGDPTEDTNGLLALTPAVGDIIYGASGQQFQLLPIVGTAQRVLTNGGLSGSDPIPKWDQVSLTAGVTGKLPLANLVDFSATKRVWGRNSAGTGVAEEVSATQLLDWLGAVNGNILYRNATDWVVLAPGTGAQVLLGGTPPAWGTLSQNLTIAQVTLSNAQLQTINTVPVSVISAPGAGIVAVPVDVFYKGVRSGTPFTGDSGIRIRWNSIASDLTSTNAAFTWNSATAATLFRRQAEAAFAGSTSDDPRNKAVEVSGTANMTGGTGNSLTVTIAYYLATGL